MKQIGPWFTIRPIRRFCKQCLHHLRKDEYIKSSHIQAVIDRAKIIDELEFSDWRHRVEFHSQQEFQTKSTFGRATFVGCLGSDSGKAVLAQAIDFSKMKNDQINL